VNTVADGTPSLTTRNLHRLANLHPVMAKSCSPMENPGKSLGRCGMLWRQGDFDFRQGQTARPHVPQITLMPETPSSF
jgi:hypothetical protein